MAYNPTEFDLETTLQVDLWYTGEDTSVLVTEHDRSPTAADGVAIARDYSIPLRVGLPARGMSYFVVWRPGAEESVVPEARPLRPTP